METQTSSLPLRVVYIVLAAVCIMIGLMGLIIPIIPGFLFLLFAVYLLSRVSHRFRQWADRQPAINKVRAAFTGRRMARMKALPVIGQIQVTALMATSTLLSSMQRLSQRFRDRK